MPNRILKESICTSESIDSLTEFQEVFFYRLIVNCDDFGRMDARPKILSSRLFPLRGVSLDLIEQAVNALVREGMIVLYSVNGKPYLQVNAWKSHQQPRANKSKYPAPNEEQPDTDCNQLHADDIRCNQVQENESDNRYTIHDTRYSIHDNRESESESLLTEDEARHFCSEHKQVLDAAEDAGFPKTNTVRASLLSLYSQFGLEKMIHGIEECATHSASSIAYLKGVLLGSGKWKKKQVPAQNFPQRDYSEVQGEMIDNLAKEIEAMREVT